ncbi:MAG: efflux transporter outer membrane subunit [Telmatospirillum sp.]|nr:efflux transporter outer membrane subunit [Telmatospirillum sp.]
MTRSRLLVAAVAALSLSGCDLANSEYLRPIVELPAFFRANPAPTPAAAAEEAAPEPRNDAAWWSQFGSADLDRMIAQAQDRNFDLAAAEARIRQAIAQQEISAAPLFPSLDFTSNATRQQTAPTSTSTRTGTVARPVWSSRYNMQFEASYEIDFWGKNRAAVDAASATLQARRFDLATVALTTEANVANAFFQLLGFGERLDYARQSLADAEDILAAIRAREAAGTASLVDIAPQVGIVEGQRATIASLERQFAQQYDALAVLLGTPQRPDYTPIPLTDLRIPVVAAGVPSELLRRRPDIASAEAQLVAANADLKNAIAQRFPSLSLTGAAGYQSTDLGRLLDPTSQIFSIAAGLTAPIFAGGRLQGQERLQRARLEELAATYQKTVVQAFADVETALSGLRRTREQLDAQIAATAASRLGFDAAQAQYRAGSIDSVALRDTQRSYFSALDALAQARLGYYQALVALFQALGGGWQLAGP